MMHTGGTHVCKGNTGLEEAGGIWFGWSGNVAQEAEPAIELDHHGSVIRATIDLPKSDYTGFYTGYANGALWPLLHFRVDLMKYNKDDYAAYNRVNERFARELGKLLEPDDIIWVHDYHLFPLGRKLRQLGMHQKIGFFLHTPFPTWQILSALPVHSDLAEDLAAYDVVGTQTADDANAMQDFMTRASGIRFIGNEARRNNRRVRVQAFPISIDQRRVSIEAAKAVNSLPYRNLRKSLDGRSLIIGVDRLDYTKGLPQRLEAVSTFLKRFPERVDDVTFLQISPPSRETVQAYRKLRTEVEEAVGRMNGQFSCFDSAPLRYLRKSFSQTSLFGFYRAARVGLVTPLRDGMNLVAKEFIACQDPADPGVLILSEFAGASRELDSALIVNPHDTDAVAVAICEALDMRLDERISRYRAAMSKLRDNDLTYWRTSFLRCLAKQGAELDLVMSSMPASLRTPLENAGPRSTAISG